MIGRRRSPWVGVAVLVLLLLRLGFLGFGRHDALVMAGPPAFVRAEPHGYSGDVGMPPDHGVWRGVGTTISSIGYSNDAAGEVIVRGLTVNRVCVHGHPCYFWLLRQLEGQSPEGARLALATDGWHASFPLRSYSWAQGCGYGTSETAWTGTRDEGSTPFGSAPVA